METVKIEVTPNEHERGRKFRRSKGKTGDCRTKGWALFVCLLFAPAPAVNSALPLTCAGSDSGSGSSSGWSGLWRCGGHFVPVQRFQCVSSTTLSVPLPWLDQSLLFDSFGKLAEAFSPFFFLLPSFLLANVLSADFSHFLNRCFGHNSSCFPFGLAALRPLPGMLTRLSSSSASSFSSSSSSLYLPSQSSGVGAQCPEEEGVGEKEPGGPAGWRPLPDWLQPVWRTL